MTAVEAPVSPVLVLAEPLHCLPRSDDLDDPLLPDGTPIRDLWRGSNYDELGFSWRFFARADSGKTWKAFETIWYGSVFRYRRFDLLSCLSASERHDEVRLRVVNRWLSGTAMARPIQSSSSPSVRRPMTAALSGAMTRSGAPL